jgi:hypothetical protein
VPGSRCVDNRQEAFLTPESQNIVGMETFLRSAYRAVNDSLVLLCWRGSSPREAFEIIDEHGNLLARDLPLAPDDAANLPPQVVSQPPVVVSELRDRQVEMEQEADMEQRKQQEAETMRFQLLRHHEKWAEEVAMCNRDKAL